MNSYLREAVHQGEALKECLDFYKDNKNNPLIEVVDLFHKNKFKKIIITGMGSSYYAAFSVMGLLNENDIPCIVLNSFELSRYQMGLVTPDTLVIAISQSGKSAEVLELVEKAKKITSVVAIVNKEDSMLAEQGHFKVWMKAGVETQITNKSYLCTLAVLNLLVSLLITGSTSPAIDDLYELADWVNQYMGSMEEHLPPQIKFVDSARAVDLVGDGPSYSSALQAGLTFREGPTKNSTASSIADYGHGWYRSITTEDYFGVMLVPNYCCDPVDEKVMGKFLEKDSKVILITASSLSFDTDNVFVIQHPDVPGNLATIPQIVIATTLMGWLMGEKSDRE